MFAAAGLSHESPETWGSSRRVGGGVGGGGGGVKHDKFFEFEIPVPEAMGDHQLTTGLQIPSKMSLVVELYEYVHNCKRNQSFNSLCVLLSPCLHDRVFNLSKSPALIFLWF